MASEQESNKTKGRPQYPPWSEFLRYTTLHYIRGPLYCVLFQKYLFGPFVFHPLAEWFGRVDLSFLPQRFVSWFRTTPAAKSGGNLRDTLFGVATFLGLHSTIFWAMNGLTYLCYKKGWLQKHQILRTKRMQASNELVRSAVVESLVTQIFFAPAGALLVGAYLWKFPPLLSFQQGRGPLLPQRDIPLLEAVKHVALAQFCNEVMFTFFHRLVHFPSLYWIHKQHHAFVGSLGFAAEYSHFIESLTAGIPPTIFYVTLCSSELTWELAMAWFIMRFWETYESHSGFCFEDTFLHKYLGLFYARSAQFHDWHHTDNRGNYGYYWIDYLFGSMDTYVEGVMNKKKGEGRNNQSAVGER